MSNAATAAARRWWDRSYADDIVPSLCKAYRSRLLVLFERCETDAVQAVVWPLLLQIWRNACTTGDGYKTDTIRGVSVAKVVAV